MKAINFIREIFRKFPLLLAANTFLLVGVSLFEACSFFTIAPVVDILIHPDLQGISPLTQKAVAVMAFIGFPVTLFSCLAVFFSFITLSSLFYVFARYSIFRTKYAVLRELILGTFDDFFASRWYFFSSNKQGTLLNIFNRELTVVGNAFGAMALFFASLIQIFFLLVVPFYISWQVASISLGVAVLFLLPFILLGRVSYRLGILNTSSANRLTSVIHEGLSLAKIILGFGKQRKAMAGIEESFDQHRQAALRSQTITIAIPNLYRPLAVLMIVIALFFARKFNVPLSELTVLLVALLQVALAIGALAEQKNSLENFFPSYELIKAMRERARTLRQDSGAIEFKGLKEEITLEGVSFAYPQEPEVLSKVNVRITKGKMVAFVGGSGAGKSTLIDIIMGFHQPLSGRLAVDGIALRDFEIGSYRNYLGYVPQESVLFNMSIRDNLLWSNDEASQAQLRMACRQAGAEEFIKELPQGYDTIVGDRGVRLSGGQVQRIALARAILRKPQILILDEATSSVDSYSERLIQEAIEKIAGETTVIVIAHRFSTVKNADYIYVLKNGRIAEEGGYLQLMQREGEFANMARLQALEYAK